MTDSQRQANRTALVTGASKGIGRATALRFASEGANVVVAYRSDTAEAQVVVDEILADGGRAVSASADLADPASAEHLVSVALDAFGSLDILINNAAVFPWTDWREVTVEEWDHVFAVNVRAPFLLSRAASVSMIERGWGRIVFVGSATFFTGSTDLMHYASSKGAAVGLHRSLARALGDNGITVNTVTTGRTLTDGVQQWIDDGVMSLEEAKTSRQTQCIKRLADPTDIVGTIAFVASDDAAYMTGQRLNVDGGRNLL